MLRCRPRRRRPPLQLVRSGPIAVEVACKLNFVAVDAYTEAKEEEKPATKEEDEDDVDEGEGENEDDSDSDSDEEDEDEEGEGEDDENKPKLYVFSSLFSTFSCLCPPSTQPSHAPCPNAPACCR